MGRSLVGGADAFAAPVRGFFGLAPGQSGLRTVAQAAPHWAWSKLIGDQAGADRASYAMRQGMVIPTRNAYNQTYSHRRALSDYMFDKAPNVMTGVMQPVRTLKQLWEAPTPLPKEIVRPKQAPWENPKLPPLPKPTW